MRGRWWWRREHRFCDCLARKCWSVTLCDTELKCNTAVWDKKVSSVGCRGSKHGGASDDWDCCCKAGTNKGGKREKVETCGKTELGHKHWSHASWMHCNVCNGCRLFWIERSVTLLMISFRPNGSALWKSKWAWCDLEDYKKKVKQTYKETAWLEMWQKKTNSQRICELCLETFPDSQSFCSAHHHNFRPARPWHTVMV